MLDWSLLVRGQYLLQAELKYLGLLFTRYGRIVQRKLPGSP